MHSGIALLLRDACPDLVATVHAIELAERTGGVVHAIFCGDTKPEGSGETKGKETVTYEDSSFMARIFSLATWWSEKRGVKVHLHQLEKLDDDSLLLLCRAYRITCLVIGAGSRQEMRREASRVVRLRKKMANEDVSNRQIFWSVIIPAWYDFAFEPVITRFEKAVWQNKAVCSEGSFARRGQ